jgi:hypothetical protein
LLRRRWFTVAAAASSAFIAVYVPHLLAVGSKVIGFLPGYLQQENYTTGTRYGIIGLLVTGPLASAMAVLILAAVALAVLQFGDPDRPWQGAVVMTAAALAVTTPHYQWYALLLVMLVAFDGHPEWLAFAAGAYYAADGNMGRYTPPYRLVYAIAYGVPILVVAGGWLAPSRPKRCPSRWQPPSRPTSISRRPPPSLRPPPSRRPGTTPSMRSRPGRRFRSVNPAKYGSDRRE